MADAKVEYIISLLQEGTGAKVAAEELKKVEAAAGSTEARLAGVTSGFKKLFATLGGVALIRECLREFLQAEQSFQRLEGVLRASGQYTEAFAASMKKLAEAMSRDTLYDTRETLDVISRLLSFGAPKEHVERLAKAVLDLSALMGRDLPRATMAMGQALQGNTDAFASLGIKVSEAGTKTKQFNEALLELERRGGGAAQQMMRGLGGEVERVNKTVSQLKEGLGYAAAEAIRLFNAGASKIGEMSAAGAGLGAIETREQAANAAQKRLWNIMADMVARGELDPAVAAKQQSLLMGAWEGQNLETRERAVSGVQRRIFGPTPGTSAFGPISSGIAPGAGVAPGGGLVTTPKLTQLDEEGMAEDFWAAIEEEQAALEQEWRDREEQFRNIQKYEKSVYEERLEQEKKLMAAIKERAAQTKTFDEQFMIDLEKIKELGMEAFSRGLAHGIVSAFSEGGAAFKKFAREFLSTMAEMILQTLILRAIQAGSQAIGFLAEGGQVFAAAGIQTVSSPTYLPKFGVVAGEAGRELLTVMANPRVASVGGVAAQVGEVRGRTLAITDAAALGRGGRESRIVVRVDPHPYFVTSIVHQSTERSVEVVTQNMQSDTPLSRTTRNLTRG